MFQLKANRLAVGYVGNAVRSWVVRPEAGTPFESLLKPEFWGHVAQRMKKHDKIEVRPDDDGYYAELLVRQAQKTWAIVQPLSHTVLAGNLVEQDFTMDGFTIRSMNEAWSVIRDEDRSTVKEGLQSRSAAVAWLDDYVRVTQPRRAKAAA